MKLPIIKQILKFIDENDKDYALETIDVLESISEVSSLNEEELNIIGELISNIYGALEVKKMQEDENLSQKDALNNFMKRVLGSIDK